MSSLNITFQGYVNHKSQQPTNDALILYTPKKHYTKSPIGCPKTFSSSTTMLRSKTLIFWELSRPPPKKNSEVHRFHGFHGKIIFNSQFGPVKVGCSPPKAITIQLPVRRIWSLTTGKTGETTLSLCTEMSTSISF